MSRWIPPPAMPEALPPLRLLERPARRAPRPLTPLQPDNWLDRQVERLANWAARRLKA